VMNIDIDPYGGVTEDDPYYVLDISDLKPGDGMSQHARRKDFDVVPRPYIKS
jgi:hypothetical protein